MATIDRDIVIRPGSSDDIATVMDIMDAAFGERFGEAWSRSQLAGILPMAGVSLTLACLPHEGETVGFSLVRVVADESELLLLAVSPHHRRRGIGGSLVRDFLDRSRNEGVARVHLEVRDGNPAIGMYRTIGFSPVGRRKNYYQGSDGNRFDAITLARQL